MRMKPMGFVLALAAGAAAFGSGMPERPADSPRTVESTIRSKLAAWEAAYNSGDRKKAFEIWAPDLVGWYPGVPDITWEQEKAALDRPASAAPRSRLHVQVVEVIVSGDLAVVRDIWTETPPEGSPARATRIPSFEVWRRQADGEWKIARWISAPQPAGKSE
ncbi:MAG TPA: nuclear transport factor 2 family protein [Thermoanaerobaculia bacterium]|nr:nuclear transport factor 2 family protein [Thermoanaerobaculia bacterium]